MHPADEGEKQKNTRSPYMVFCDEQFAAEMKVDAGSMQVTALRKDLRERWSKLSAFEKARYTRLAASEFAELQRAKQRKAQILGAAEPATTRSGAKRRCVVRDEGADVLAIEADVLIEARNCQLEGALRNLAGRKEIVVRYISARQMLDALKASGGLVNKAKDTILAG